MAEAILRHLGGDRFTAFSAGLHPTVVHPLTPRVLAEIGVESTDLRAKSLGEFLGKRAISHAIILCEVSQADCPRIYPFALRVHAWPFDDPSADSGESDPIQAFRRVRDQILRRIEIWLEENSD